MDALRNNGRHPLGRQLARPLETGGNLAEVLVELRPRLDEVEEFIQRQLRLGPRGVVDVGGYVFEGGGKRLRPALLLLVSRMLGYEGERDVRYAAVMEMIHSATLVHDDIIDHADVRRGRPTANNRWGNQMTVLLGDWLYARSIEIALEVGDVEVLRVLSRATIQMIEGEMLGLEISGNPDVSEEVYLEIVRRKTAEVFVAGCTIPTLFAPELARYREPLETYGRNLGICFQIADDLLDLTASEIELGKPVFSDLLEGKLTLPFIRLLPRVSPAEREKIVTVLRTGELGSTTPDDLRAILERERMLDEARELAYTYGARALDALLELPPGPERDALASAPAFVIGRDR